MSEYKPIHSDIARLVYDFRKGMENLGIEVDGVTVAPGHYDRMIQYFESTEPYDGTLRVLGVDFSPSLEHHPVQGRTLLDALTDLVKHLERLTEIETQRIESVRFSQRNESPHPEEK